MSSGTYITNFTTFEMVAGVKGVFHLPQKSTVDNAPSVSRKTKMDTAGVLVSFVSPYSLWTAHYAIFCAWKHKSNMYTGRHSHHQSCLMGLSWFSIVCVREVGRTEGAAVCSSVLHLHDCIIFLHFLCFYVTDGELSAGDGAVGLLYIIPCIPSTSHECCSNNSSTFHWSQRPAILWQ